MRAQASAPDEDERRWALYYRLWAGNGISDLGSSFTYVALPLLAVLTLGASPFQVGVLNALEFAGYLGFSLLIGVWVDRSDRRKVMIAADLARAVLVAMIVVLAITGYLSLWLLFVIAGSIGILGVYFTTAGDAYLRSLVPEDQFVRAMKWKTSTTTVAEFLGRSGAGVLVPLIGASRTLIIDAVSFVMSAIFISRIPADVVKRPLPRPRNLKEELADGFDFIWHNKFLRGLMGFATHSNFLIAAQTALAVPFLLQTVGASSTEVGVVLGLTAIGAFAGSLSAEPLAKKFRAGRVLVFAAIFGPVCNLVLPLTTDGWGLAWFIVGLTGAEFGIAIFINLALPRRAKIVPDHMFGRVGATMRTSFRGSIPIGAVVGGLLGELIGLRLAMAIVAGSMLLLMFWVPSTGAWRLSNQDVGMKE